MRGDFGRYLVAVLVTVSGNWAQNVVLGILAFEVSGSALVAGLAISLRQLPLLLLAPFAGRIIDRHDRTRLIATCQAAAGVVTFAFFLVAMADLASTPGVLGFSTLLGLFSVLDVPSRVALVADLVSMDRISPAMAAANTASALGRVIGPATATAVMATSSYEWVFLVNAASYLVTSTMFGTLKGRSGSGPGDGEARPRPIPLRQVLRTGDVGAALLTVAAVATLVVNSQVVLLVLVDDVLMLSDSVYGALLIVLGVGGVGGTLAAGRIARPSLGLLVGLTAAAGVLLLAFSATRTSVVLLGLALVGGIAIGVFATAAVSFLQRRAPDGERGRVVALFEAVFTGAAPLGATLAGSVTEGLGARSTLALFGLAVIAVAVGALLVSRRGRSHLALRDHSL